MFKTASSVSLEYPLSRPLRFRPLPRRSRSMLFCDGVPKYRWQGFTHFGLSQVCSIHLPLGIPSGFVPVWSAIMIKRAARQVRPLYLNRPYPSRSKPASHSQHWSSPFLLTLGQNLASAWSTVSFMPRFAITGVSIASTCW